MTAFSPPASAFKPLFITSTLSLRPSTLHFHNLKPTTTTRTHHTSFIPNFNPSTRCNHVPPPNTSAATPITATAAAPTTSKQEEPPATQAKPELLTDPSVPIMSPRIAKSALTTLLHYYRDLSEREPFISKRLAAATFCIVISKLVGLTVPFFLKTAIDELMRHASTSTPSRSIRAACIAILLHGVARIIASLAHELRNAVFAKAGQRIGRSITATSFAHVHSLELAFHTTSRTGALTRVIDRGTRSIMTIFRAMLFSFFPSFFELMLVCCVLFSQFSFSYVLVTLLMFTVFTLWTLTINNEMSLMRSEMNAVENEASAKLTDSLLNVEAVKVFNNAKLETKRYDRSLMRFEQISIGNEKLYARLNIGQTVAFTIGLTALLLLATRDIVIGQLTVGSLVLLTTMLQRLWIPLDFLGWQYREVKQSLIDIQNLFDILKRQPKIVDAVDATELRVGGGAISFEDVSFVYPEPDVDSTLLFTRKQAAPVTMGQTERSAAEPASGDVTASKKTRRRGTLDRLNFQVVAGSSMALVGASGSGKSTATRLLCRLYDIGSGRILIDGQDISKVSLSSLRKAVSIVPQDTALFNETIGYNIRYGRPDASDEEVIEAAKAASIHDVIMRTGQGYDTMVGERGVRMSGGERQRLSVARAFLKGSRIIIEDESTSALDTLTELEVSKALRELGVNRTRILVAHRLSTVMNVDEIVVMKGGRKVEHGSFNELVSKDEGLFRDMWQRQQRKEAQEAQEAQEAVEDDGQDDVDEVEGVGKVKRAEDEVLQDAWPTSMDA